MLRRGAELTVCWIIAVAVMAVVVLLYPVMRVIEWLSPTDPDVAARAEWRWR